MIRTLQTLAAALSLALSAGAAIAHEYWVLPAQFHPDNNAVLTFHLQVGDGFPGESRPRDPTKLERFFIEGPGGRADIGGIDGRDPAGMTRLRDVGVHVAAYEGKPTVITLEAEKFNAYLKEVGLDHIVKDRADRGETAKEGSEAFQRCAKTVICVEKTNAAEVWKKALGLKVEFVPQSDIYAHAAGDEIQFLLLSDGKPMPDTLVRATNAAAPQEWLKVRTDANGLVNFKFETAGTWLINSIRMERRPDGSETDWLSTWSSLTFELAPAPAAPTPPPAPAATP